MKGEEPDFGWNKKEAEEIVEETKPKIKLGECKLCSKTIDARNPYCWECRKNYLLRKNSWR